MGNLLAPALSGGLASFALPAPAAPQLRASLPVLAAPGETPKALQIVAAVNAPLIAVAPEGVDKAPAESVSAASSRVMDGLGEQFAGAGETAARGRSVYVMSKPLNVTVELGPVARVLHWVGEAGWHMGSAALLYHATGNPHAAATMAAVGILKMPPVVTAQSAMDLSARYWWYKFKSLKELAFIPDVRKIKVLTGGETDIKAFVAFRRTNRGIVFLETSKPLPEGLETAQGKPILIDDIENRSVKVEMSLGEKKSPVVWEPTLKDLLEKKPMPKDVARAWREEVKEAKKEKSWFGRFFDYSFEKSLKIDVALVAPNGSALELGTLAQGASAKRMLGITRVDQARRALHKWLFKVVKERKERAIPLDDVTVERRAADSRSAWEKIKQLPVRVWRRLSGRLIVAE